ncbi:MAG: class I SAM-dependent methyltransferase [Pseudomonadota bacterium]
MRPAAASITPDLVAVHAATRAIYDKAATGYDAHRAKFLFERPWLDRFLGALPDRPTVADVGCGAGEPIARYLIGAGCRLTGIDCAPAMLAIARKRFADHTWIEADMRTLALKHHFDGLISWDAFFHLSRAEQRQTIPRLAEHVAPGGAMMLTVGPKDCEGSGTVEGEAGYHASLDPAEYESLLTRSGFSDIRFVKEDPECDFHSVVLASNKKP